MMIHRLITKSLYSIFNQVHGNKLEELYEEVKQHNSTRRLFDEGKLKRYLESWGLGGDITDLPIMTKQDVREYTKRLDGNDISSFVYTGGSTGDPLKLPYSKKRELMRTASIKYYNEKGGYRIGDKFLLIRAKPKSKFSQFLRNEILFVPYNLSSDSIYRIAKQIVDQNVVVLIGYPSVIYEIALMFEEATYLKENHTVKSIITVSEPIDDMKRLFIKKSFGCSLIDRYSNEETGVIAQQKEFGGDYIVDRHTVFTEILDADTLRPAAENKIGKVVVTDVYNDLIPVVRYDTGDYAMVSENRVGQLFSINKIVGRTSEEIYTTDGTPVSSLTLGPCIHKPFSRSNVTCQFQFAQVGEKQYQFRIKAEDTEQVAKPVYEAVKELQKVLGKDAVIEPVFLSIIDPLPSGKRPLYRNEFTKASEI